MRACGRPRRLHRQGQVAVLRLQHGAGGRQVSAPRRLSRTAAPVVCVWRVDPRAQHHPLVRCAVRLLPRAASSSPSMSRSTPWPSASRCAAAPFLPLLLSCSTPGCPAGRRRTARASPHACLLTRAPLLFATVRAGPAAPPPRRVAREAAQRRGPHRARPQGQHPLASPRQGLQPRDAHQRRQRRQPAAGKRGGRAAAHRLGAGRAAQRQQQQHLCAAVQAQPVAAQQAGARRVGGLRHPRALGRCAPASSSCFAILPCLFLALGLSSS